MVSCQKGPTRHAYSWQIGPFWHDTLDLFWNTWSTFTHSCHRQIIIHKLCVLALTGIIKAWRRGETSLAFLAKLLSHCDCHVSRTMLLNDEFCDNTYNFMVISWIGMKINLLLELLKFSDKIKQCRYDTSIKLLQFWKEFHSYLIKRSTHYGYIRGDIKVMVQHDSIIYVSIIETFTSMHSHDLIYHSIICLYYLIQKRAQILP